MDESTKQKIDASSFQGMLKKVVQAQEKLDETMFLKLPQADFDKAMKERTEAFEEMVKNGSYNYQKMERELARYKKKDKK